ncbi:MAG: type II secretion system protein [Nitrospirae bacterium]|nr:type II secretion system protein [Nitrospirota bacterium]
MNTELNVKARVALSGTRGVTLIELVVVIAIIGVLAGLMVSYFGGMRQKMKIEGDVRQFYSTLMDLRSMAMAAKKSYGVSWTSASDITSYNQLVAGISPFDNLTAGSTVLKAVALTVTMKNAESKTLLPFTEKGLLDSDNYGGSSATFYVECRECDSTSPGCDPENPTTSCNTSDMTSDCSDVQYPEYSCINVSLSRIKMGKWCNNACRFR